MVMITKDQQQLIAKWEKVKDLLSKYQEQEKILRAELCKELFPNPVEGTNNVELENNHVLKGSYVYTYKVDGESFKACMPKFEELNIAPNSLVGWTPKLSVRDYKALTDEQRNFVDAQFLTISKPALLSSMQIVKQKR